MKVLHNITVIFISLATCQFAYAQQPGEVIGKHIFGLARDYQADPVIINGDPLIHKNGKSEIELSLNGSDFTVSLFDDVIGSIYLSQYNNNRSHINTVALDVSGSEGISRPVWPILTEWDSVFFSESVVVDAARADDFVSDFKYYFKEDQSKVKPYHYGWVGELVVFDAGASAKVIKNYAMGRVSASRIVAMPDNRTFYLLDAENSGHVYVFVANKQKSMTQGDLYVMYGENENIRYLKLGDASSLKIKFRLDKVTFDKMFSHASPTNGSCPDSYRYISTIYGEECLLVKRKYAAYAGKFEPVRYAAIHGAVPYMKGINSAIFDAEKRKLILGNKDNKKSIISLVSNESMNSDYIAEVMK